MNNANLQQKEHLTFRQAWINMLNGNKVKRPNWSGYWAFEQNTINTDLGVAIE